MAQKQHQAGRSSLARRLLREKGGTAAVEFVLVAPLFLMLAYGAVVYGIFFATWVAVSEAASEGARASLAGLSSTERQSLASTTVNRVFSAYQPLLSTQNMTLSFPTQTTAGLFAVSIGYDFTNTSLANFATLVPLPNLKPQITVTVSNGGY
jgi:Flp pilus assembly protein TadG